MLLLGFGSKIYSQSYEAQTVYEAQAYFLYNICKYMQWPSNSGNFIIGVVSNDPIVNELKKIATTRKYINQTIEIVVFKNIDEISKTNVLYVPGKKNSELKNIAAKIKANSTLLVSNKQGAIHLGSEVNLLIADDGKLKFELKKSGILDKGIKVNNSIEKLAMKNY